MTRKDLYFGVAAIALAAFLGVPAMPAQAQQMAQSAVTIDGDDIAGVVTSPKGPEAGVWVIAETSDLPTKFARIVVTDDQGRYVIPDLPTANYQVWVRGYGLSTRRRCAPSPASISTWRRRRRRPRPRRRIITRRSTGTR
jgi:hypothetical protein